MKFIDLLPEVMNGGKVNRKDYLDNGSILYISLSKNKDMLVLHNKDGLILPYPKVSSIFGNADSQKWLFDDFLFRMIG